MKLKSLLIALILFAVPLISVHAQTSAGNSFYMDYPSWNAGSLKPPMYIDCGNNNLFNTGQELTMEVWIRLYNSAWNQKILGKVTNSFNNGYVMAIEVGKNYSEIWDPNLNEVKDGSSPNDSAWVHLATTYAGGGTMFAYINGVNVGAMPVAGNGITSSSNNFIIGLAPWDLLSLQTFGNIDEVRIWSVARTQSEINETMHKQLTGNEPGLVAYYDFNVATGTILPDRTANQLDGTVSPNTAPFVSWQNSYAAVGNEGMYDMHDVSAIWYGKDTASYNFSTTTKGLNLVGQINPKAFDYAVYGDNDSTGISNTFLPAGAASDFKRLSREWYFNTGGTVSADLYFNMITAAGGGTQLQTGLPVENYTLLVRDSTSQVFTPLYAANAIPGGTVVKFGSIQLQNNKFYTLGVGSTQISIPNSVQENELFAKNISISPNPAGHSVQLYNISGCYVSVYDELGKLVKTTVAETKNITLPLYNLESGMYYINFTKGKLSANKKLIIQK